MNLTDQIIYEILVEQQGYKRTYFMSLNEDEKSSFIDGIISNMKRWHFDNCKNKNDSNWKMLLQLSV